MTAPSASLPRIHLHTIPHGTALPDPSSVADGWPFLLEADGARSLYQNFNGVWTLVVPAASVLVSVPLTADHTLALTDAGKVLDVTTATTATITVPPHTDADFPIGSLVRLTGLGTGTVTVAPGAGVTIHSLGAEYNLAGQYGWATLRKLAADVWLLSGATS